MNPTMGNLLDPSVHVMMRTGLPSRICTGLLGSRVIGVFLLLAALTLGFRLFLFRRILLLRGKEVRCRLPHVALCLLQSVSHHHKEACKLPYVRGISGEHSSRIKVHE